MPSHVYILRCADNGLYVGYAEDASASQSTTPAAPPSGRPITVRVVLVYHEEHETKLPAIKRERQIKRWTHAKKLALIDADRSGLKSLAKRRVF